MQAVTTQNRASGDNFAIANAGDFEDILKPSVNQPIL